MFACCHGCLQLPAFLASKVWGRSLHQPVHLVPVISVVPRAGSGFGQDTLGHGYHLILVYLNRLRSGVGQPDAAVLLDLNYSSDRAQPQRSGSWINHHCPSGPGSRNDHPYLCDGVRCQHCRPHRLLCRRTLLGSWVYCDGGDCPFPERPSIALVRHSLAKWPFWWHE